MQIIIEESKSRYLTAKVRYSDIVTQNEREVYLCSKYNPVKEAKEWVEGIYKQEIDTFVIYGVGIGYHINALLEKLTLSQKIQVIETNLEIYKYAKKYNPHWESESNLQVFLGRNMEEVVFKFETIINDQDNKYGMKEILFHQPSINIIPEAFVQLREVLEMCLLRTQTNNIKLIQMLHIKENRIRNEQKQYKNVKELFGLYKDKTCIIVSAGPSLENNIDYLKNINEDVIVLATGRVIKTLMDKGIRVDLFCIVDAQQATELQIEGIETLQIPFVFLNTTFYGTVEKYQGPKYMGYSTEDRKEEKGSLENGGSVATVAIDLATKLGVNKIILIGQDLAYTNGQTHIYTAGAHTVYEASNMRKVKSIDGTHIPTTLGLFSMKRWIEGKIQRTPSVEFINCTEGGAYIEGCEHKKLEEIV